MSTEIEFLLLVSQPPNTYFLNLVRDEFDDIVRKQLLTKAPFATMTTESGLKVGTSTKVTSVPSGIDCPDDWLHCPTIKLILSLTHDKELRAGQLRYHVLRAKDSIIQTLKDKVNIDGIMYVGLEPAAASFEMTLVGTGEDLELEAWDYFERVTANFLDDTVQTESGFVTVFDSVTFAEPYRRNLRALSGSLAVSGQVYGAQGGFLPFSNFAIQMNNAVSKETDSFMGMLRRGEYISAEGHVFTCPDFVALEDITASFSPVRVAALSLSPEKGVNSHILLIIGMIFLAIFVAIFGYYSRRRAKERSKYKEELQEYRDQMKTQRREKRDELQQSLDQKSDGEITAASFKNKFADDLEAAFELGYEKYKETLEKLGEGALSAGQLVGAETSDDTCSQSKERCALSRNSSATSASGLSLFLEEHDVQSDLEDDFSDSSSEEGGNVSGNESVASGVSRASTTSSRSLLSVFMEKQAETQARQGFHVSSGSSVTSGMTGSLKRSDPLKSQSEHIPKRSTSYIGNQYATDRSGVRRTVSGDFGIPSGRARNAGSMRSKSFDGIFPGSSGHLRDPTDPNRQLSASAHPCTGRRPTDQNHELSASAHSYSGRRIYLNASSGGSVCSSRSARATHSKLSNRTAPVGQAVTDKACRSNSAHSSNNAEKESPNRPTIEKSQNFEQSKNGPDLQAQLSQRFEHLLPPSAQSKASENSRTEQEKSHRTISSSFSSISTGSVGKRSQNTGPSRNADSCRKLPERENGTISPRRSAKPAVCVPKDAAHQDKSSAPVSNPDCSGPAVVTTAAKPSLRVPSSSANPPKKGYLQEFLDSDDEDSDGNDTQVLTTSSSSPDKNSPPPKKLTVDDFIHRIELFQQEYQQHRDHDHHHSDCDMSSLSGTESLDSIFLEPEDRCDKSIGGSAHSMRRSARKKTNKSRHSSSKSTCSTLSISSYDESVGDISCAHSLDDNIIRNGELTKKAKKRGNKRQKSLKIPTQIIAI
eukprot:scaffold3421_cov181-Amphora_coffeaeformis.AAC.27